MYKGRERRKSPQTTEKIVEMAVEKALPRAFTMIGFDISRPHAIQKDMAFLRWTRLICITALSSSLGAGALWIAHRMVL